MQCFLFPLKTPVNSIRRQMGDSHCFFCRSSRQTHLRQIKNDCSVVAEDGPARTGREYLE